MWFDMYRRSTSNPRHPSLQRLFPDQLPPPLTAPLSPLTEEKRRRQHRATGVCVWVCGCGSTRAG